nr:MAG TPA: hypothetical protein [Caudoviricetes sp.]
MIDYYRIKCTTYVNGKEKSVHSLCNLLTEEQTQTKEIKITWENLNTVYYNWGLVLPFNYYQFKKGRVISFFRSSLFDKDSWDIKEWKQKELDIVLKIQYEKVKIALRELQNYDVELVNQFLKDKNLDMIRM